MHRREDEAFHVLEGEVEFTSEGITTRLGPGATIHLARGTHHRFTVVGERPARMLILSVPSGLADYFATVGEPLESPAAQIPPVTREHIDRVVSGGPAFGIEFPGFGS